jgi:hypothetical protein
MPKEIRSSNITSALIGSGTSKDAFNEEVDFRRKI